MHHSKIRKILQTGKNGLQPGSSRMGNTGDCRKQIRPALSIYDGAAVESD